LTKNNPQEPLVLGIDTGGTYTDGVLLEYNSHQVIAAHKSLTTKRDFSIGIENVIKEIELADPGAIQMVSISTTLATNAIAEGKGKRVALFLIGYDPELIDSFGLGDHFATPHYYYIKGGHDLHGQEQAELDLPSLLDKVKEVKTKVDAIAVSSYFSPRNPEHEIRAQKAIASICELPIVLGHQLSTALGSVERATTAALNASLLAVLQEFIIAVRRAMENRGIDAPLMVVRGDGTLMNDEFAARTPVETIHSGPAASAIGGRFLSQLDQALVLDVGGTTTDLALVLDGLDVFLKTAFEADGASTEGTGYWQYGLSNVIPFAEMLRIRTEGEIDLLGLDRLADIAAYPLHVVLSPGRYASFSDCAPSISLIPGNLVRLAERTGVEALPGLMASPAPLSYSASLPLMLRTMLWWDGERPESLEIDDAVLPEGEVVRFVTEPAGAPQLVLAAKAGHNAENHNQNDVGSFILHMDGEDLLCDPGRGLYSRQYFSPLRYDNIFASAYGHSVPVIGGQLQADGLEFAGELLEVAPDEKRVVIAFGDAYPVEALERATRALSMDREAAPGGTLWVEDAFHFSGDPLPVEEVFVTWADVELDGATATLIGERADVAMTIEAPEGAAFAVKALEEASIANKKEGILKRLTFDVPPAPQMQARVRVDVYPHPEA